MKILNKDKICTFCDKNRQVHSKEKCRSCYEKQLMIDNPEYHERKKEYLRNKRKEPQARKNAYERHLKRWSDPEYRKKDKLRKWNSVLSKYGLNQEEYEKLVDKGCEICGRKDGKPHLDHCHETGNFRGLLCSKCNNGLGMFGDNIEGLKKAIKYLENKQEK